jgi:hypothetical protein
MVDICRHDGYNLVVSAKRQQRTGQKQAPRDAIQEAIDYGIDVSALRDNLARTPAERLRRHQIALDRMRTLQKAKRL